MKSSKLILNTACALTLVAPAIGQSVTGKRLATTDATALEDPSVDLSTGELASLLESGSAGNLFDALVHNTIAADSKSLNDQRVLTPAERTAVFNALGAQPRAKTRSLLDKRIADVPSIAERLVAMEVLGQYGRDGDLNQLLEWAQLERTDVRIDRTVVSTFQAQLGAMLERRPQAIRSLLALYQRAHLSLLPAFVTALGEKAHPDRLGVLTELLGQEQRFDAHVLSEINVLSRRLRFTPGQRARERVRRYLSHNDPKLRHQAIMAVEGLGDGEAVAWLLELLDSAAPTVAKQVVNALCSLTGESFGSSAEAWNNWHQRTEHTWRTQGKTLLSLATNGPPGRAAAAIQELATLRIFREEITDTLASTLMRSETELAVLAAASIGHLGSMSGIPHLLEALEDTRTPVRRSAYLSLRRMTGENHGDQSDAWRAAGWGVEFY